MTVEEKVQKASNIIIQPKKLKINFAAPYPYTTENINGYLPHFVLKDKSLLTVGSSSDQLLNAMSCGCKDITIIDRCSFSKEYFELKKAAILSLPLEEYLEIFSSPQKKLFHKRKEYPFTKERYEKLRDALSCEESFPFWEELINTFPIETIRKNFFIRDEYPKAANQKTNAYLKDEQTYQETKKMVTTITPTFITGDILQTEFHRQFDNIWLSNLLDYRLNKVNKERINYMIDSLTEDGKILLYYLYAISFWGEKVSIYDILDPMDVIKYFPYKTQLVEIPGVDNILYKNNKTKDGILVYQKEKTRK